MKSVIVKLDTIDKVKAFSNFATNYIGDLDLVSGRYTIDAKSIMGIFSMDLSKELKLVVHGTDESEIDAFIEKLGEFVIK